LQQIATNPAANTLADSLKKQYRNITPTVFVWISFGFVRFGGWPNAETVRHLLNPVIAMVWLDY
jgi:hypothetical protein